MRGRRPSLQRRPPPSRSLPQEAIGWRDSGGEAASLREAPLPQTPSPEEWLGIGLSVLLELCAHARWVRLPAYWLRSRRLTEPPRPCGVGDEPLRPPTAGTSPFRGGFAWRRAPKAPPSAEACEEWRRSRHRSLFRARWERLKGLCDRPLETFARSPLPTIRYPTLAGRGGSVSRRDHNPAAGTRAHLSGGTKPEEAYQPRTPAALRERGVWGERRFSQRSRLSPQNLPHPTSLEEGARGRGLFFRKGPSLAYFAPPSVPLKFTLWHLSVHGGITV